MGRRVLPQRSNERITPDTTVAELANNSILDSMTGPQLIVYLRILGVLHRERGRSNRHRNVTKINPVNLELYPDSSTAARVLKELAELGLVRLRYEDEERRHGRTVEVLR